MAVKPVLLLGNPKLILSSEKVAIENRDFHVIVKDLKDTLRFLQSKYKIGRALAACQIGVLKRIIYMEHDAESIVMINPEILERSQQQFEVWDSCYSGNVSFFGKTMRYKSIKVEFLNEKGEKEIRMFENDLSELFQHEIDHLNGVLFTDRIINNQIIMRSEWQNLMENQII